MERLPANIGQVVRNILQQSLSMEETLAQGIGSTIESQRFSTEQLSIFARMLAQIGALAEKGFSMELSDETKALLTQFKNSVVASAGGRAFEPVLLSKAAFELVDSKTPEQLPPALLEMLTQPRQSSEPAQLLRQLVDLLMPKPRDAGNSAQVQQQAAQVQQQARPTAAQQMINSVYRQFDAPYAQPQQAANIPASDLPAQQTQQPLGQTANVPAANQTAQPAPIAQNFSAPAQTANIPARDFPAQQVPQPSANVSPANQQTAKILASDLPAQQVQQPSGQSTNISTANQQVPASQPAPTANQPPQQMSIENNVAQNSPAPAQPANLSTTNQTPIPNQPAPQPTANQTSPSAPVQTAATNQQPIAQNFSASQPTANIPARDFPAQSVQQTAQPSQPQPTANQPTQPAPAQTATANQPAQPQQRAETPRDDFTVNVPKKPQASPVDEDFIARQRELMAQMQFAKTQLLQQPLQNTPQTTDALKNLAQFLIRNPASAETMSQRETTLLQNFVNSQQTVLPRDEARHLQNLLRLCQQNVPAVVQQAAAQHKLPDLPRLWAFMQLCDMASLPAHMPARALKRAAREVSDFSNAIRQSMGADNTTVQNQRSFQMMLPLYLGGNFSSYPTYLSVYDETARDKETGAEKKETWLRICVLTDNIGAAELIFRVYEKTQLDMRFYFSQGEVAEDFKSYVASLRNFIGGTSFSVGEIRIGSIGEKLLLAQ